MCIRDRLGAGEKWRNTSKRDLFDIITPEYLTDYIEDNANSIETIFHLGAISATTETNADLFLENNILKISGSRDYINENDNSEYHYQERTHGSFHRSFKLPISVVEENISATFRNGILTVVLPKNEEAQPKQRTIKIK